ncbi:STAS domain-containing protein [Nonomuraea sp. FMUSA5-5]|uniref:Anti-sigma factor antagonist n=1 Tax=Nonomuraea composti TaxID=2720023 RepID=A0ABX1BCJ8_9ACTN|nr:STAS domain-containing protein [Nonomuraea sp. FMUSA5-5]NJP92593.1 STAS domain-containing protein [Nonomuraea sp. FMUSA5-5]
MKLTHRYQSGACVLTIDGEVDVTTSQELETYLDLVRRSLDDHLIVDAGRLSFLDSSGLTVLLAAAILAQARGAAVHLVGLQPRVARILEITGAMVAIRTHEDVEQALTAVGSMSGTGVAEPV